jgi:tRNA (guanine-N7-)-methyltransferase
VFPNGYEKYELEIGCGKGQFIIQKALKNPQINYIGMEKEQTVVGVATRKAVGVAEQYKLKKLPNLYFLNSYAEKLADYFQPKTFQKIYLNFSDP